MSCWRTLPYSPTSMVKSLRWPNLPGSDVIIGVQPSSGSNLVQEMLTNEHDLDLEKMTDDELRAEVRYLRDAIRAHRDNSGHNLCWYVPELWNCLPEKVEPSPTVPEFSEFIQNCCKYRKSLDK